MEANLNKRQYNLSEKAANRLGFERGFLVNSDNSGYGIFILDDETVYFLENHLSRIYNLVDEFGIEQLLVVCDTLFRMIEYGLYPLSKLQIILLHLLKIKPKGKDETVID